MVADSFSFYQRALPGYLSKKVSVEKQEEKALEEILGLFRRNILESKPNEQWLAVARAQSVLRSDSDVLRARSIRLHWVASKGPAFAGCFAWSSEA